EPGRGQIETDERQHAMRGGLACEIAPIDRIAPDELANARRDRRTRLRSSAEQQELVLRTGQRRREMMRSFTIVTNVGLRRAHCRGRPRAKISILSLLIS